MLAPLMLHNLLKLVLDEILTSMKQHQENDSNQYEEIIQ
jgi:hypothetical protein